MKTVMKEPSNATAKPVRHSQRGLVIWHGMRMREFFKLVNVGMELHWSQLHRILPTLFMTFHNSVWGTVEQLRFRKKIQETEIQSPIIVLGHWRSGTTLLHNLLTLDDRFTYPNLYECVFPHHFLTTESIMSKLTSFVVPKVRPMDNMKAGWELPQEDEMALLLMTTYSPYRNLAFQGHRERYEHYFSFADAKDEERETWKRAFRTFLKKLTIRRNRPIVLKSPTHTYRLKMLQEMFPAARYVYIHRHPYEVLRSTIHLRGVMFQTNALGKLNLESHEELIYQAYEECIQTYEANKHLIPEGHLTEIGFEELEQQPLESMRRIYQEIGLPDFKEVESNVEDYLAGQKEYKKNKFPTDPELAQVVNERMKFVLDQYGYDPVVLADT